MWLCDPGARCVRTVDLIIQSVWMHISESVHSSCDHVKMNVWTWSYLWREHVGREMLLCVCLLGETLHLCAWVVCVHFLCNKNH